MGEWADVPEGPVVPSFTAGRPNPLIKPKLLVISNSGIGDVTFLSSVKTPRDSICGVLVGESNLIVAAQWLRFSLSEDASSPLSSVGEVPGESYLFFGP